MIGFPNPTIPNFFYVSIISAEANARWPKTRGRFSHHLQEHNSKICRHLHLWGHQWTFKPSQRFRESQRFAWVINPVLIQPSDPPTKDLEGSTTPYLINEPYTNALQTCFMVQKKRDKLTLWIHEQNEKLASFVLKTRPHKLLVVVCVYVGM